MKEVVYRRYFRLLMEDQVMPNLIIMDGGEIQVNAALETLASLNLEIPVMGLKKDDAVLIHSSMKAIGDVEGGAEVC